MRNFGLIGYPLSHSFSKGYFAEKFQKEGLLDCRYENYPLPSLDGFPELVARVEDLRGLNVTIPHKEAVIALIDTLDDAARDIGAVNTILFQDGKTTGFNTDIVGFARSLQPLLRVHHDRALILGTGGASKAVAYCLSALQIPYRLVSRRKQSPDMLTYGELTEEVMRTHRLIINTTPLGTSPQVDTCPPIPYHWLEGHHLLYDLVYNPAETLFLRKGKAQGAAIKNGYQMLVLQAEASWAIWTR